MRRRFALLLLAALLPAVVSCSAVLEREYYMETPHSDQSLPHAEGSVLIAETYEELVAGILSFVSRRAETGVIRLYNPEGEAAESVQAACLEVSRVEPLGAYAVDYILPESVRVVSYYEVTFTIGYRRSPEEMRAVMDAVGNTAMRRALEEALTSFSETLTLSNAYFFTDETALRALVREACLGRADMVMGLTGVDITFYPAEGTRRIIEFHFRYPADAETLAARRVETQRTVREFCARTEGEPPARQAELLRDALREGAAYVPPEPEAPFFASAWDVLAGGGGGDASFALAFRLLCNAADLSCALVSGTLDGSPRTWNIVTADGRSAHVDTASAAPGFFSDDDLAALGYEWRRENYPPCAGWEN